MNKLVEALERISQMCPATCDMTVAHEMAAIADEALAAPRATDAEGLVERLRSSATAFRENPIYTQDGDPVLLTVQADELDEAATTIAAQAAEIERLRAA